MELFLKNKHKGPSANDKESTKFKCQMTKLLIFGVLNLFCHLDFVL